MTDIPPGAVPTGFVPIPRNPGPFGELVGPFYVTPGETPPRYGMRLTTAHMNLRGVSHGGMLMTFTDHMLGYAVIDAVGGEPCATMSLTCDIVRAGMPGDWIVGSPELVRITRSIVFVRGTLTRGDDVIVTASGVWKRLGQR